MDNGTPKIRFGIAPSMSARISEQEHRSAGSGPTTRIAGGTSARIAEEEERARRWAHEPDEEQAAGVHPYGVSLRAQGGRPCTIEELMSAESAARYGQSTSPANQEQDGQVVPATALASQGFAPQAGEPQATVEREVFRSLPVKDRISATTGEGFFFTVASDSTKEGAQTTSRSPFQTLRSLFTRNRDRDKHDG